MIKSRNLFLHSTIRPNYHHKLYTNHAEIIKTRPLSRVYTRANFVLPTKKINKSFKQRAAHSIQLNSRRNIQPAMLHRPPYGKFVRPSTRRRPLRSTRHMLPSHARLIEAGLFSLLPAAARTWWPFCASSSARSAWGFVTWGRRGGRWWAASRRAAARPRTRASSARAAATAPRPGSSSSCRCPPRQRRFYLLRSPGCCSRRSRSSPGCWCWLCCRRRRCYRRHRYRPPTGSRRSRGSRGRTASRWTASPACDSAVKFWQISMWSLIWVDTLLPISLVNAE